MANAPYWQTFATSSREAEVAERCRLCEEERTLLLSQILPAFVFRWAHPPGWRPSDSYHLEEVFSGGATSDAHDSINR